MIKIEEAYKCSGCHACAVKCPNKCIEMKCDKDGFKYPIVNKIDCIHCGLCIKICPILNKEHENVDNEPSTYAAYNINDEIRLKSSSGGIFTLLANEIINQNGVVFGAKFDNQFKVVHSGSSEVEEVDAFRGSKYVQSDIGTTFLEAKTFLEQKRKVLFTGTPCQIAGLYSFLGNNHENLYTQDIICHGVPSPYLWYKYLSHRKRYINDEITAISFRNKDEGWRKFNLCIKNNSQIMYKKNNQNDPMIKAFLNDLCLRPSCYNCSFKGIHRQSDITLADFWGIENVTQELNDDKGVSLVMINSKKGKELLSQINNSIISVETDLSKSLQYNKTATISVLKPEKREQFLNDITEDNFDDCVFMYTRKTIMSRIKNKIHLIRKRVF